MNINDTDAFIVYRTDENGESVFQPILGEDVKNLIKGFDYNEEENLWMSPDGTITIKLKRIG